ncbi:MAG TPA: bifunctional demethylmenaquinone methyltransferase/2-methoxy-6-polyprenyl-1,4-benzoquinol methylase UbiE [Desulfomonilaceae bacterium]|nr:bifunctional demethylmenaquinone methyltransferase/2-methoxy-6-polyprenyl-1,4-benzoquinol methylase UbiE [Desulfomonilaceae bacterium]
MNNPKAPRQDSLISAAENRAMFERIAGFYDGTNRILSLGFDGRWRRRAVQTLGPVPGGRYLDVGCGTGDMSLEIVRQAPGSTVVGIDPVQNMLSIAREKIARAGADALISIEKGDVLNLDFEDDSFDAAITAFCIRNVTDRRRGLEEINRVIKPGGLLVILELTEPNGPVMKPLFRIYARVVMPAVTRRMSSVSAYRYLADSMADFPQPEVFSKLMEAAAFTHLTHQHLTGGIVTIFSGQAV